MLRQFKIVAMIVCYACAMYASLIVLFLALGVLQHSYISKWCCCLYIFPKDIAACIIYMMGFFGTYFALFVCLFVAQVACFA